MQPQVRVRLLRLFLRVLAAGLVAAFVPWITLILTNAPVLAPGGALAPLLRFRPYNPHYESMLTAIHLVWAVMLWRASADPARHTLFLDFTMWANAAHGLVMLIATPMQKGLPMTFVEGVPLFGIAAVLWWLRPLPAPFVEGRAMGETKNVGSPARDRGDAATATFAIDVEATTLVCPTGERYAAEVMAEGRTPVLSCEGPCIRGEIARQAANRLASQPPFARACQGEAMTVPGSGMARWVRGADRVVVVDGCFLRCQARQMRGMLGRDQLVEIDVLPFYNRWTDRFAIDDLPEAERSAVADAVAERLLAQLTPMMAEAPRR